MLILQQLTRCLLTCTKDGNCISGVMVSVLASSVVDCGFKPDRVKPKTIKLVCVASLLRNITETEQRLFGLESG